MNLFKGYGFAQQTNPTVLTSIFATPTASSGSLTLVANQQIVGSVIHVHAAGTITTGGTYTVNFSLKLNGGVCTALAVASVTTGATSWEYDGWIYCTVVGGAATATMVSTSIAKIYGPTVIFTIAPANTSLNATVNTTTTQLVDLQASFGTSSGSNVIQVLYCDVEQY